MNWIEFFFLMVIKPKINYSGVFWLNFGILVVTLIGTALYKPVIDWTKENQKWDVDKKKLELKQIEDDEMNTNSYLKLQIKKLQD